MLNTVLITSFQVLMTRTLQDCKRFVAHTEDTYVLFALFFLTVISITPWESLPLQ